MTSGDNGCSLETSLNMQEINDQFRETKKMYESKYLKGSCATGMLGCSCFLHQEELIVFCIFMQKNIRPVLEL